MSDGKPFHVAEAAVRGRAPDPAGSASDADPWAALEVFIDHVAHLVLHAQALADRMEGLRDGTKSQAGDRDARVQRLRAAVQRGQRVIADAAGPDSGFQPR